MRIIPRDSILTKNRIKMGNTKITNNKEEKGDFKMTGIGGTLSAKSANKVDRVCISGHMMDSDAFIKELSSDILSEVHKGKTLGSLNDIKMQIAMGTYDINADDIVDKILG